MLMREDVGVKWVLGDARLGDRESESDPEEA